MRYLAFMMLMVGLLGAPQPVLAKSKVIEIPYSKQYRAFSCGHNSFRMVMGYWGVRLSRQKIINWTGVSGSYGKIWQRLVKERYKRDFSFSYVGNSSSAIKKEIDRGRPVFVGLDASYLTYLDYDSSSGHFIVVVGYDDSKKKFYLRDPNSQYVEELPYNTLKKATRGFKNSTFVIYKKTGSGIPKHQIKHFDKAYPLGAPKKKQKGIPLSLLLPQVHVVMENPPAPTIGEGFEDAETGDLFDYHIHYNGFSYGETTIERNPLFGNGQAYNSFGFNAAYTLRVNRFRLGAGEFISPGVYSYARHRTLDTHNFTATKQIPALTLRAPTVEVAGVVKRPDETALERPDMGLTFENWGGVRVGARYGIHQALGHASVGASRIDARVKVDAGDGGEPIVATLPVWTYDGALGPFYGSYQSTSTADAENVSTDDGELPYEVNYRGHTFGVNMSLPGLRSSLFLINWLSYAGIFRMNFEHSARFFERKDEASGTSFTVAERTWDVELPVRLIWVDMVYGWSVYGTEVNQQSSTSRGAFVKLIYNNFMPFAQIQFGYRVGYRDFDQVDSQQFTTGVYFGI